jgi:hypothetical protein
MTYILFSLAIILIYIIAFLSAYKLGYKAGRLDTHILLKRSLDKLIEPLEEKSNRDLGSSDK